MSEEERKQYKKQEETLLKAATKDEEPLKFKHVRSMFLSLLSPISHPSPGVGRAPKSWRSQELKVHMELSPCAF